MASGILDPWWVKREDRPVSVATQLRTLTQRADGTISWRTDVPGEERAWISEKIREATGLLAGLDVHDTAALAAAAQQLIGGLGQSIAALTEATIAVASAAQTAGIPLHELSTWTRIPAEDLQQDIDGHRDNLEEHYG